jgi:hypothetical protein
MWNSSRPLLEHLVCYQGLAEEVETGTNLSDDTRQN